MKKPNFKLIDIARKRNIPLVYDIVDSWNQPDDDALYKNDKQARDFFLKKWNEIDADA